MLDFDNELLRYKFIVAKLIGIENHKRFSVFRYIEKYLK
jgi:hypothetical protein